MKRLIAVVGVASLLGACTTVRYNGAKTTQKDINTPRVGETATAFVGDPMLRKATLIEDEALVVEKLIDGALYNIPAKTYRPIGYDSDEDFYSADGVTRSGLADPIQALALPTRPGAQLCVITVMGGKACYDGHYERKTEIRKNSNSVEQQLIYSGRVGDTIKIGYREFRDNLARPAFSNEAEYDLSSSRAIGYKGAKLRVIKADNSSITYKVVRGFP